MGKKKTNKKRGGVTKQSAASSGGENTSSPAELDYIVEGLQKLAVPIEQLELDPANARKHGEADLAAIAASLKQYKQRTPIVVNSRNNQVAKGNGTLQAAIALGWSHIAVVFVEDDESTQRGYAIADNRTAELSKWDLDSLALQLDELAIAEPDLYDALLLDELRLAPDEGELAAKQTVPDQFEVVATCADEAAQKELYQQLSKRGYQCRLLTL